MSIAVFEQRPAWRLRPIGLALAAAAVVVATPFADRNRDRSPVARPGPPGARIAAAATGPVRRLHWTMGAQDTLATSLRRAGVRPDDGRLASKALQDDFDVVNPHPGLPLALVLGRSDHGGAPLLELALTSPDGATVSLKRRGDGGFALSRTSERFAAADQAISGIIDGSLYLSIVQAGLAPDLAHKVVRLFGRNLDLSRDIESGDAFRIVLQARPGVASDADLLYARIHAGAATYRLYRFAAPDGTTQWLPDGDGPTRPLLLRTPVDGARITSGFGMRLHPILGFSRMHQGVDFGAPLGSAVFAAGDGVVEQARWNGGYGRWLEIRHRPGLETGYAHLLAWASGIAPGVRVRQGEVVGFVGASGLATGPHLHFEVRVDGQPVNPATAPEESAPISAGERADFEAQKAQIEAEVAQTSG